MKTVAELEAELKAAKEAETKMDRASRKAQSDRWNELIAVPENWEWQVVATTYRTFRGETMHGARVLRRMNPEVLREWQNGGFPTFSCEDQKGSWEGMFYYRTDEGILTHDGGGLCVLRDPKLCSDAEWEAILAGDIAEKFKRTL